MSGVVGISHPGEKAWRFTGEMEEIAATLRDSSVPEGFFSAAAEVYQRQA